MPAKTKKPKYITDMEEQLYTILNPYHKLFEKLSIATYEKASCNGYITFAKNALTKVKQPTIKYLSHYNLVDDNAGLLRKLLQGTNMLRQLLVIPPLTVEGKSAPVRAIGVGSFEDNGTLCEVHFKGPLKWEVISEHKGQKYHFILKEESPEQYHQEDTGEDEQVFFTKMKSLFGLEPYVDKSGKEYDIESRWKDIYDCVLDNEHGTMIVVLEEAEAWYETQRLYNANRGFKVGKRIIREKSLIQALTAIDGCLVFDNYGILYGYGFILDGMADYVGDPSKGARHNSARTYIGKHKKSRKKTKALACVFSEDGGSKTICTLDKNLVRTKPVKRPTPSGSPSK